LPNYQRPKIIPCPAKRTSPTPRRFSRSHLQGKILAILATTVSCYCFHLVAQTAVQTLTKADQNESSAQLSE
jgi:hypothetical protein